MKHDDDVEARIHAAHVAASAELQGICLEHNTTLHAKLANDIVCVMARHEVRVHEYLERAESNLERMEKRDAEAKASAVGMTVLAKYVADMRRYWHRKFCPGCWLWSFVLRLFGVREPVMPERPQ